MPDPENSQREQLNDRWKHLPASVRDPSLQRLDSYVPDDLDDDDEELTLLSSLVREADREMRAAPPRTEAPRARRFDVKADDNLDVFREARPVERRPRVLEAFRVDDVEIDDLIEQLATTAAALRQRKAA
jgi:hypothetical protein